ncbi:MAG: hypothetical protein KZQ58_06620 [gamma proteobacterium symbiont of Bathyaustriella thionipta]|nr:hypothetical protein [gamma proteobacterium symbiont of Bathyaustriella thionipta]
MTACHPTKKTAFAFHILAVADIVAAVDVVESAAVTQMAVEVVVVEVVVVEVVVVEVVAVEVVAVISV